MRAHTFCLNVPAALIRRLKLPVMLCIKFFICVSASNACRRRAASCARASSASSTAVLVVILCRIGLRCGAFTVRLNFDAAPSLTAMTAALLRRPVFMRSM